MRQDLHSILKANIVNPKSNFESDILHIVYKKNAQRIVFNFWLSIAVGIVSIIGLVPAVIDMTNKLKQSGFYEYFNIVFSNGGIISKYSNDLFIVLGELIPGVSITIFLIVLVILLWSIRNIFKQTTSPYFKLSAN